MASAIARSVSSSSSAVQWRLLRLSMDAYPSSSSASSSAAAVIANKLLRQNPSSSYRRPSQFVDRISAISDCSFPFAFNLRHAFHQQSNISMPHGDPEIEAAFKDLMAMNWDEIPDSVVNQTKKVLSKDTEDKSGKEALLNVFRAAEAVVEFGGVLISLRMTLDDLSGLSGENVGHLPEYVEDAIRAAYKRYMTYLDSFGPNETYLRKKVEAELGTKMIHLKMRCSGIGSEWGKVTLLGTSGISGSYVELRS